MRFSLEIHGSMPFKQRDLACLSQSNLSVTTLQLQEFQLTNHLCIASRQSAMGFKQSSSQYRGNSACYNHGNLIMLLKYWKRWKSWKAQVEIDHPQVFRIHPHFHEESNRLNCILLEIGQREDFQCVIVLVDVYAVVAIGSQKSSFFCLINIYVLMLLFLVKVFHSFFFSRM